MPQEKIRHRLKHKSEVPDFMDKLIAAYDDKTISYNQLKGNASILIAAGSETTATLLSGRITSGRPVLMS